jgi:aminomethyltransferase
MHSSYALDVSDFAVERNGAQQPLSELWPGGYQPGDRLGVILAQPMDAVGCSNLISATVTLFYDYLRKTLGTGNFFRYCDTYLFGVGCEAGDFNQLDIWPLHKWVTILNPTTEALLEAINDRKVNLLAIPETGARCRGEVVLSTWNAYQAHVKSVFLYSPRTGVARDADVHLVGNKVVESYVEQAIFSTPGLDAGYQARLRRLRRNIDREEKQCVEGYRTLPSPVAARALLGVTQVLPPGHQELTRRATPTTILPVEVPMPPLDGEAAPFDTAAAAALQVSEPAPAGGVYSDGLLHTAFDAIQRRLGGSFAEWEGWDWISDFGDPIAEHHTVRESVGIWDESPLRKWLFRGKDALAAADYCFTADMAGLEVGQARYAPFVDAQGKMLGDGVVFRGDDDENVLVVTALDTDGDHFRRITKDFKVEISDETMSMPHLQVQGPGSRALLSKVSDADIEGLRYFRFTPQPVTVCGARCYVARTGYSGELGYEIYCEPGDAERVWQGLIDEGASVGIRPYGLAAVESLRIEAGLIFLGYDYFPAVTSPFHMNLDRMIKLDKGDFYGKDALQAELDAGITHRMVTLEMVTLEIAGEEAPDYNTPVLSNGRGVGKLTSPSAGRSPTVDKLIAMACIETELTELGTQVEVTLPDGRLVPAIVAPYPIYDTEKTRPRS